MTPTVGDEPNSAIQDNLEMRGNVNKFVRIRKQLIKELFSSSVWYYQDKRQDKRKIKYVLDKSCPYAQKNGRVMEHYYVWWKNNPNDHIRYNEEIHHINEDPTDNRIENLMKVKKKDHVKLHVELRRRKKQVQIDKTEGGPK